MHIILTHEQADFDALASLLGAYLLHDTALPVLPRRMNRNLQAFLALYGAELPLIEARDLPGGPIEMVTLVDTQSMVSIKGMSAQTRVQVIDHHPLRENLPQNWTVTTLDVGATTTLMVEGLREQDSLLTPIQATLLLLGIYEDTGSLTYTRTTSRDMRAAAYLLDQGASLQIANNFLNHPLSPGQQALYDRLRTGAEQHLINGHTVIIASGDASEMDEELSTIAHKVRDLLDPDALFFVVATRGGVQMIARSTSDNIDVADIVAHFGGGGHARAAAALIRDRTLADVHTELVHILPEHVRPTITVGELMSLGPQLLSVDTPVEEAARRMQRYGYEGYPVVRDGKVVGLLTRRAVDRALSHKLNLTAASLMQAGEYTVSPEDSLEHLQRLVTETGWGQIPVVDSTSGEIIGIVTRTDLLKMLSPQAQLPSHQNLARRLEAALPASYLALLKAIADMAHTQHAALYIVGGYVRDMLLERRSLDFDLVVEGDAVLLARALARRYGGRVTGHSRFGTAKWHLDESWRGVEDGEEERTSANHADWPMLQSVDLVSARTEFYTHPTALPTVERSSIKLDLHRRDFTINTLAMRLDGHHYGELHDYWGGLNDLRQGWVRVLHSLSFVDDPTRILRAVRFEVRFSFKIDKRTVELLDEARPMIARLTGDRIRHELNHILRETLAVQILARLHELGLLKAIHPSLIWDEWLRVHLEMLPASAPDPSWGLETRHQLDLAYVLCLIRLPSDQAQQVIQRLNLPVALARGVQSACTLWAEQDALVQLSPSAATLRLEAAPPLASYALYLATSNMHLRAMLEDYATRWQRTIPFTDGFALKELEIPPGPVYRRILGDLRAAWLDGAVKTSTEEQALLRQLLQELGYLSDGA